MTVRLQIPWPTLFPAISVHAKHFTLEIPISTLIQNSKHPRKLLLYIAWAVYGQQGTLCLLDGPPLDKPEMLSGVLPDEVYSFIPLNPNMKRTLCDPKGGDDRTSISPEDNTRPGDLRDLVSERDGHRCVLVKPLPLAVKYPAACKAIHLLPHSKGDEYMQSVVFVRPQEDQWGNPTTDTEMRSIDDLRNMLFLDLLIHPGMGTLQFGFLCVPNAVLSMDDILVDSRDSDPDPNLANVQWQIIDPTFYDNPHLQVYDQSDLLWNNKFLRLPPDSTHWPPFFIWHFLYGVSALTHWLKDGVACEVFTQVMMEDYCADDGGEYSDDASQRSSEDKDTGIEDQDTNAEAGGDGRQGTPQGSHSVATNQAFNMVAMMWKHSMPEIVEDVAARDRVAAWVHQTAYNAAT